MLFPKTDVETFKQIEVVLVVHFSLAWVEQPGVWGQKGMGVSYLLVAQETMICSHVSSNLGFGLPHAQLRCGGLGEASAFGDQQLLLPG